MASWGADPLALGPTVWMTNFTGSLPALVGAQAEGAATRMRCQSMAFDTLATEVVQPVLQPQAGGSRGSKRLTPHAACKSPQRRPALPEEGTRPVTTASPTLQRMPGWTWRTAVHSRNSSGPAAV